MKELFYAFVDLYLLVAPYVFAATVLLTVAIFVFGLLIPYIVEKSKSRPRR